MRILLFIFSLFLSQLLLSQEAHWIFFNDKGGVSASEIKLKGWLTESSLQRRYKQAIPLDQTDLPVYKPYVQGVLAEGGQIRHASRWLNAISVVGLSEDQLLTISQLPYVKRTSPVKQLQVTMKDETPSNQKWFDYGDGHDQIQQVSGIGLHQLGFVGDGKTIAVIDGGFVNVQNIGALSTMRNEGRLLTTYNFVNGDSNVFVSGAHGTAVLSIMAAEVEGALVGTAPKANYMLLTSEDDNNENLTEEDNWVAAAEFADSAGADVINSSLGYTVFDNNIGNHTYLDMDGRTTVVTLGAVFAHRKGMVVCVAAGNEGQSAWQHISAPADADSILAVGAVDQFGVYAPFTSTGPSSDGRIKPDVAARGVQTAYFNTADFLTAGNGTSLASPIITGMSACLWQARPFATNYEIMDAVRKSAHQFHNPDDYLGYGIPNFYSAMLSLDMEEQSWANLKVFPNPSSDVVQVNLSEGENTLALVNAAGEVVFYQDGVIASEFVITVSDVPSGEYILRIRNAGVLRSVKLSVVH